MNLLLRRFLRDETGATAIEYGLIAVMIGVGLVAGLGTLKNSLSTMFNQAHSNLN
jgi:pilus assembly protein Flp/PilA